MIEAFGGRKFLAWVVQEVILIGVLVLLLAFDKMTDGVFYTWFAAVVVSLGIYVQGNVAVDKAGIAAGTKPPDPSENHVG
jgi:hypothetical protein